MTQTPFDAQAWRAFRGTQFPAQGWHVSQGELCATAGDGVDLITRERYRDFWLSLEWWLPPRGNSGVFYRVSEDADEAPMSGPEVQLLDAAHPDALNPATACGALYDLLPTQGDVTLVDGYNHLGLMVSGSAVEHWINGRRVLAYDWSDPSLAARIATSKFAGHAGFARSAQGGIVLQHHGTDARFRNIDIRRID